MYRENNGRANQYGRKQCRRHAVLQVRFELCEGGARARTDKNYTRAL